MDNQHQRFSSEVRRAATDRVTAASVLALTCLGASSGLAVSAAAVSPFGVPSQPEDVVLIAGWWAAATIAGWWISSVVYWLVQFGSSKNRSATPAARASGARFTLPGSRRIAEAMFTFGLVAIPACSPEANPPTMVLIGTAPATTDLAASAVPSTTTRLTTTESTTTRLTTALPTTALPTNSLSTTALSTVPSSTSTPATLPDTNPPDTNPPDTNPPDTNPPDTAEPPGDDQTTPFDPDSALATPAIAAHVVLVNAGDNLWLLSAEAIEQHLDIEPSLDQITRYWRLVVSANHVRSGNANLIVPGESISMPAFSIDLEASNALDLEGAVESLLGTTG